MEKRIEAEVPTSLVEEIEDDVQQFRQARLAEIVSWYSDQSLLVWTPDQPSPPSHDGQLPSNVHPLHGPDKYHGDVSKGYDAKRESQPKWVWEQQVIEKWLSELPEGSWVLDIPCGTGRFIPFYEEHGLWCHAVDKSEDQIYEAIAKRKKSDQSIQFEVDDVRTYGLWPDAVHTALMIRLTRWLSPEDCQKAIRNLQRIAKHRVIFTTRVEHPKRPELARPISLFAEAFLPGWRVSRMEIMPEDTAYHVIMLESGV